MAVKVRKSFCFWATPIGGIVLAGLLIPLLIFSYKAYGWGILTDKDIVSLNSTAEEHRSTLIVQSDSIEQNTERIAVISADLEMLKAQYQETVQQTEILEALYELQTGEEWEERE
ncbi:MAG: hypothetical protein KAU20_03505 [Nanoarchaeota archaeon]|nr:hypothetical protein [Nanoarchaeota archaeon]